MNICPFPKMQRKQQPTPKVRPYGDDEAYWCGAKCEAEVCTSDNWINCINDAKHLELVLPTVIDDKYCRSCNERFKCYTK